MPCISPASLIPVGALPSASVVLEYTYDRKNKELSSFKSTEEKEKHPNVRFCFQSYCLNGWTSKTEGRGEVHHCKLLIRCFLDTEAGN